MTLDQAIQLAVECLSKIIEEKPDPQKMSIVIIPTSTKKFQRLTDSEVAKFILNMH